MIFYSHANKIRFHNQGFAFCPGFESETFWNSEMVYLFSFKIRPRTIFPLFSIRTMNVAAISFLDGPRGRDPSGQRRESGRKGPLGTRLNVVVAPKSQRYSIH